MLRSIKSEQSEVERRGVTGRMPEWMADPSSDWRQVVRIVLDDLLHGCLTKAEAQEVLVHLRERRDRTTRRRRVVAAVLTAAGAILGLLAGAALGAR